MPDTKNNHKNLIPEIVSFLLVLGIFFALGIKGFAGGCLNEARSVAAGKGFSIERLEAYYNERVPLKNALITLNGGFRKLLGQREVNERYRLDNGHLTYVIPELDMSAIAENTVAFCRELSAHGVPMAYISTPFKVDAENKQLPPTVEDYSNENADRFLAVLKQNGVPFLDLRESFAASGKDHYGWFFPTDHHWTPEAGLYAVRMVTEYLREQDESFAVQAAVLQEESFTATAYQAILLGSSGRRTGPWYSGFDDITVLEPAYETELYFSAPEDGIDRTGSFSETILFPEHLTRSHCFENDVYDVYCGKDYGLMQLKNLTEPGSSDTAPTGKKLLVLQDSFGLVTAPFLALGYQECTFLDLRLFEDSLMRYIEEYGPDMVLVFYNPGALEDNNWNMFDFR
ncbi:MAG: hypothetical protein IKT07_04825 [Oscillospiraceae bacterium]|nr:hypothetical protein [Oscillospiraceae bacterium]